MNSPHDWRTTLDTVRLQAGEQLSIVAEEGKSSIDAAVAGFVLAAHDFAERLDPASPIAALSRAASSTARSLAADLKDKSVESLITDGREMVRRAPMMTIAIAALSGFVLTRFLNADGIEKQRDKRQHQNNAPIP